MMEDTPSNYNAINQRFENRKKPPIEDDDEDGWNDTGNSHLNNGTRKKNRLSKQHLN